MDAAVAAATVLEDCPLFNAGKGAVFNIDGKHELEVSLMLSKPPSSHPEISPTRRGFSLSLLTRVKNPAKLARALYLSPDKVPHAFLSGSNAEALAESLGEALVDPSYFFTEHRWREHRRGLGLPEEPLPSQKSTEGVHGPYPMGTIGAVALDARGCIAVVTSTGGRTNKLVGRIGDTPMFGAVSGQRSGGIRMKLHERLAFQGPAMVIQATASTIAHRIKFLGEPLTHATEKAVESLLRDGALGGVIALDASGNVVMPMNSPGMYRGVIDEDGMAKTAIFSDDVLT
ncbi:hypothetical protein APHAL10511_000091 [Amanita phalloides]|nr:hypothetical protein APHAL10511_000091 [Amanita phalloides]